MAEQCTVTIIEHDNGELSVTGNDQKYIIDFERSFRVEIRSLLVNQSFDGFDKTMRQNVRGVCSLDSHEQLSVIGDPKNKTKTININIDPINDDEYDRDGDRGEFGHTARVYFFDYIEPTWGIWIGMTVTTYNHLVSEIRAGQVKKLSVDVKFFDLDGRAFKGNMYTDEPFNQHATASHHFTWFLRPRKADGDVRTPESARGIVENISWCGEEWCSAAGEDPEWADEDPEWAESEPTKTDIQLDKLLQHVDSLASSALAVHTTLTRLGWMALIVLTVSLLLKLTSF